MNSTAQIQNNIMAHDLLMIQPAPNKKEQLIKIKPRPRDERQASVDGEAKENGRAFH